MREEFAEAVATHQENALEFDVPISQEEDSKSTSEESRREDGLHGVWHSRKTRSELRGMSRVSTDYDEKLQLFPDNQFEHTFSPSIFPSTLEKPATMVKTTIHGKWWTAGGELFLLWETRSDTTYPWNGFSSTGEGSIKISQFSDLDPQKYKIGSNELYGNAMGPWTRELPDTANSTQITDLWKKESSSTDMGGPADPDSLGRRAFVNSRPQSVRDSQ